MITTIKIKCNYCGKEKEKKASEIKRQKNKGRKFFYCDPKCAGKINCSHLKEHQHKNIAQSTERIRKYKKQHDQYSHVRYHLRNAKKHAKNKECSITLEYLKDLWNKQNGICAVTNLPLDIKYIHTNKQRKKKNPFQASLDRIDNLKGYIPGNIRFVCLMFNYARNNFSEKETLDFFKKVISNEKNL